MCGAGTKITADSVRGKSCAIRAFAEHPGGSEFDPRRENSSTAGGDANRATSRHADFYAKFSTACGSGSVISAVLIFSCHASALLS